jgi:hypothetical protein
MTDCPLRQRWPEINDRRHWPALIYAAALIILSACSLPAAVGPIENIGYREARFAEIEAARNFRKCRGDALTLDREARKEAAPARYLASAKLLERCESAIGPTIRVAREERLRASALAVQNRLKGGDIAGARGGLARLQKAFPDQDLYDAESHSFIDTMEVLLGLREETALGAFSSANVGALIKRELRRARHWRHN